MLKKWLCESNLSCLDVLGDEQEEQEKAVLRSNIHTGWSRIFEKGKGGGLQEEREKGKKRNRSESRKKRKISKKKHLNWDKGYFNSVQETLD